MRDIERIADQARRALDGEAWHGPALAELLADVDAGEAAAHPLSGAHSIWEIVLHVTGWQEVVRRRTAGEEVEPTATEDWPEANGGPADWEKARQALVEGRRRLEETLRTLGDDRLDQRVPGASYSQAFQLQGLLQHDAYHGGQIALLKKALREPPEQTGERQEEGR